MLQLNIDEDSSLRREHKFFFRFSPMDTDHVDKIHGIFLDNASACTDTVRQMREELRRSLPQMPHLLPDDNPADTMKIYKILDEIAYKPFLFFYIYQYTTAGGSK